MIKGAEQSRSVVSVGGKFNVRLFSVIPQEMYYPGSVSIVGDGFSDTCYCQLSLEADVVALPTMYQSDTELQCILNDRKIEKALET